MWLSAALGGGVTGLAPSRVAAEETQRRWIKHTIVPGERLDDIAVRYGVTKAQMLRWNKSLRKKQYLYAGRTLKVYARRFPPPRRKITYTIRWGDSWQKIADRYNVRIKDLRRWNKKIPKRFRSGQKLVVYTNPRPAPPRTETSGVGPGANVPPGGFSVGRPNRGRLVNGVQLPQSDDYTIRRPELAWGSSKTIRLVVDVLAKFRRETGFTGAVPIGAISKQGGGRLRPHKSHQSGRDVDIGLPRVVGLSARTRPTVEQIDWGATWQLLSAFAETDEVEYIFLERSRQDRLIRAARKMGATAVELDRMFQFRHGRGGRKGLIRHAKGHTIHFHIRFKCADEETGCERVVRGTSSRVQRRPRAPGPVT